MKLIPRAALLVLLTSCAGGAYQAMAQDRSAQRGHDLFELWCAPCHKPLGEYVSSVPATTAMQRKYPDRPAALEERTDLTPDYVRQIVRSGVFSMPFFRKTELSDADVDALGAYLATRH